MRKMKKIKWQKVPKLLEVEIYGRKSKVKTILMYAPKLSLNTRQLICKAISWIKEPKVDYLHLEIKPMFSQLQQIRNRTKWVKLIRQLIM